MPKEVIQVESAMVGGGVEGGPRTVVVGWQRGMYVQLATIKPDGEDQSGASGQYVDLERHHINALIRHLRRARDQAFGQDE